MALLRLPLSLNRKINFWKLLGCGKNGTFDIHPDWRQWVVLTVNSELSMVNGEWSVVSENSQLQVPDYKLLYGSFITWWWKFFKCEIYSIILEPLEGYGTWDNKKIFHDLPRQTNYEGAIAVLTRATIHLKRLKNFWKHVDGVASEMKNAEGLIISIGIGEMPRIKQATFSVWETKEQMKAFAYHTRPHTDVIHKTRNEEWYKEEMFVRFKPVASFGSLNGNDPLKGKL
jgi:hypothetical protein